MVWGKKTKKIINFLQLETGKSSWKLSVENLWACSNFLVLFFERTPITWKGWLNWFYHATSLFLGINIMLVIYSSATLHWVPLLKRFHASVGRTADTSGNISGTHQWLPMQAAGKLVKQQGSVKFLEQKRSTCCKGLAPGFSEILNKLQVLVSPGTWSSHVFFIRL